MTTDINAIDSISNPISISLCLSPKQLLFSPMLELAALSIATNQIAEDELKKPFIVLFHGIPHDIGPFISDHPGGSDIIRGIKEGSEISDIMSDGSIHAHSKLAFKMLAGMRLKLNSADCNEKSSFLDLSRPLVWQLFSSSSNMTKEHYINGIHIPQFLNHSARLFESDYLEMLSKTAWWVIPSIWIPVSLILFILGSSIFPSQSILNSLGVFLFGVGLWNLLEYLTHRFLFHIDATPFLLDNRYFLTTHFFLHGIHHFMPLDPYRLVMPPIMTTILSMLLWGVFSAFLSSFSIKALLMSGLLIGYVKYDLTHYNLHHYQHNHIITTLLGSQEALRKKHNSHHYKTPNMGFGVSSSIWDIVFNTLSGTT